MEKIKFIANEEFWTLRFFTALIAFLTVINVSSKLIGGYNRAIKEKFSSLETIANNSLNFWISDCCNFFPHELFFTFFLLFAFLFILSARRFIKIGVLSSVTFLTLTLTLFQATYLSLWFADTTNIEWNSTLIQPNIFDGILYFCFSINLFVQIKIICRFAKEKFQAKISLK